MSIGADGSEVPSVQLQWHFKTAGSKMTRL